MKKVAYWALSLSIFAAVACNNSETASSDKIDFTQSYENAALALTSAQENYTSALATNDSTKINAAKQELETAKTNYVNSKNALVEHGGTVKQEYESKLTQSEETLSKLPAAAAAATQATADSAIGGKVGQAINSGAQKVEDTKAAVTNTVDKVKQTVDDINAKKVKAQQNIQATKEQAQKDIQATQDKAKQIKDGIGGLLKK